MGRTKRFFRGLFSPRLGYLGSAASTPTLTIEPPSLTVDALDETHSSAPWPHPGQGVVPVSSRQPRSLPLRQYRADHPAADRLVAELRSVNTFGGAFHAAFSLGQKPFNDGLTPGLVRDFLRSPALTAAVPELGSVDQEGEVGFDVLAPADLTNSIAGTVVAGGYQGKYLGTEQDAIELAEAYLEEIAFDPATWHVRRSFVWWSDWFGGVVWDTTWLMLDLDTSRIFVLARTDTD